MALAAFASAEEPKKVDKRGVLAGYSGLGYSGLGYGYGAPVVSPQISNPIQL